MKKIIADITKKDIRFVLDHDKTKTIVHKIIEIKKLLNDVITVIDPEWKKEVNDE